MIGNRLGLIIIVVAELVIIGLLVAYCSQLNDKVDTISESCDNEVKKLQLMVEVHQNRRRDEVANFVKTIKDLVKLHWADGKTVFDQEKDFKETIAAGFYRLYGMPVERFIDVKVEFKEGEIEIESRLESVIVLKLPNRPKTWILIGRKSPKDGVGMPLFEIREL